MTRHAGALGPHPTFQFGDKGRHAGFAYHPPLLDRAAIGLALGRKDVVDATHRLGGQRGFAGRGQGEEVASPMAPTRGLGDRPRIPLGIVQIAKAGVSIGLKDASITSKMSLRVLAAAVARVVKQCRRRVRAGKWPVISDLGP